MKVVNIEVLPMNAGEVVTATIKVEGGEAEGYENRVQSGTPQATQRVILNDDQRVVVEGKVEDKVELDNDQRAARKRPIGEKAEEQQKKDEERNKRVEEEAKKEEERLEKEMPEEAKLRKVQEKERDEKIQGRQDVKAHEAPVKVGDRGTGDPSLVPQPSEGVRDRGLRHETPPDSKSVQDHASTTKPKR